jgi:hypothetical protein
VFAALFLALSLAATPAKGCPGLLPLERNSIAPAAVGRFRDRYRVWQVAH